MKRQSENLKQTKGGRGGSVLRFQILPRQTERQYLEYIHYLWLSDLPVWQYVIIIKTYKSRSYKRHVQDFFMWHKLEIKLVQKMFECQPWHKYNWHKCNLNLRVTDRPTLGICLIPPAQRISPEEKRRKGGSTTRHINRSEKERPENSSQSMFSLSFLSVIHEARYKAIIALVWINKLPNLV